MNPKNPFKALATRPIISAVADGVAMVVIGILSELSGVVLEAHGLWSREVLTSGPPLLLLLTGTGYIGVKVATVNEIRKAFDFDDYVDRKIAPTYADSIADAIAQGDNDRIVDLSRAVHRARSKRKV
jgi:hypothetical protein